MKLSLIFPLYNESARLGSSMPEIINFCKNELKKRRGIDYEVIFVDDGSSDATKKICNLNKGKNMRVISYEENRGKGYAIKLGMLNAEGDYILFSDIDLSTPLCELFSFLDYIDDYDIVIASRALRDSKVETRLHKKVLGRISHFFIKTYAVDGVKDTQCGFKLFSKDAAKKIFEKTTIERWGFDFEVLYLAKKYGFLVKELPVKWKENTLSKVRISDYPKTFRELREIRKNDKKGYYE